MNIRCILLIFCLSLFGCNEKQGSEEVEIEEFEEEIATIENIVNVVLSKINQRDECKVTIEENTVVISFELNDFFLDEETNYLFSHLIAFELFDQISQFEKCTFILKYVAFDEELQVSLIEEEVKSNYQYFQNLDNFPEMVYVVLTDVGYDRYIHSEALLKQFPIVLEGYDFNGSFWELLMNYSDGVTNGDSKKVFWFKSFASFLLTQDSFDGVYKGIQSEQILMLLELGGLTESDVERDLIMEEWSQFYQ